MATRSVATPLVAALLAAALAVTACSQESPDPVPRPGIEPSFVHGTDGSDVDRIAAATVTDAQRYWQDRFPRDFGKPWHDLDGGAYSVDTTDVDGVSPPCSGSSDEIEGNAYYCGSVDAIAWDRSALLPVLREHYGDTAVVAVLAHEIGHAVQQRTGQPQQGSASQDRSIRTEAMADCYAGSFARSVADGRSEHLRTDPAQLDSALRALITFRDPVGTAQATTDAHGSAFDRVSAFQDGYRGGPTQCAGVGDETAKLTGAGGADQQAAGDGQAARDGQAAGRGQAPANGNAAGEPASAESARAFFARLTAERGAAWTPPPLRPAADVDPERCPGANAPAAYCARPPAVLADRGALAELRRDAGEQAPETLLASRYALAAQSALRLPLEGADAGRRTTCLTGAYTGSLRSPAGSLGPGDLDGAVSALLSEDGVSRDVAGSNALSGFDRVAEFRKGLFGGGSACGV